MYVCKCHVGNLGPMVCSALFCVFVLQISSGSSHFVTHALQDIQEINNQEIFVQVQHSLLAIQLALAISST